MRTIILAGIDFQTALCLHIALDVSGIVISIGQFETDFWTLPIVVVIVFYLPYEVLPPEACSGNVRTNYSPCPLGCQDHNNQ